MKRIIDYFKNWELARIIRAVLALILLLTYIFDREPLIIFAAAMLGIQAIFNISCPGGSCSPTYTKDTKQVIEVKKYEPKN